MTNGRRAADRRRQRGGDGDFNDDELGTTPGAAPASPHNNYVEVDNDADEADNEPSGRSARLTSREEDLPSLLDPSDVVARDPDTAQRRESLTPRQSQAPRGQIIDEELPDAEKSFVRELKRRPLPTDTRVNVKHEVTEVKELKARKLRQGGALRLLYVGGDAVSTPTSLPIAIYPSLVGRSRDADLVLTDPTVSLRHLEIGYDDDGFNVVDLGSRSGTLINGVVIGGRTALFHGDIVSVGKTELRFMRAEPLPKRRPEPEPEPQPAVVVVEVSAQQPAPERTQTNIRIARDQQAQLDKAALNRRRAAVRRRALLVIGGCCLIFGAIATVTLVYRAAFSDSAPAQIRHQVAVLLGEAKKQLQAGDVDGAHASVATVLGLDAENAEGISLDRVVTTEKGSRDALQLALRMGDEDRDDEALAALARIADSSVFAKDRDRLQTSLASRALVRSLRAVENLLDQGRVDDARREARRAIELAPELAELHQTLGLIEEGADNLAAAEVAFKKAASLDGNVEFRLDVARVQWRQDLRTEAEATWAAIGAEYPSNRDVQLAVANSFHGLGRNDEAFAAFGKALTLSTTPSEKADVLVEQSRVQADQGKTAVALELLSQARTLTPDDPDIHYNLGVLLFRAGQLPASIVAFDAAVKLKPDHDNALNNKGVAQEKLKRLDDAVATFNAAIGIDTRNAFARYNLGLVLFKLRRFKEAEAAFEGALKVDKDLADARFFLGEIYFQLGDTKKALRLYKDALHSNPDDAGTHRRIGDLHLQNGDLDLAIGEYWAAVDADQDNEEQRAQLIRVLLARNGEGDVRRAVKLGDAGLEKHADHREVRIALAAAEVAAGRSPRARQLLEEGTTIAPKDAAVHIALGRFLLEQGQIVDAERSFATATTLDPRSAGALAGQGDAALSQGDAAKAQKLFEQALAIDSSLASTRRRWAPTRNSSPACKRTGCRRRKYTPLVVCSGSSIKSTPRHTSRAWRAARASSSGNSTSPLERPITVSPACKRHCEPNWLCPRTRMSLATRSTVATPNTMVAVGPPCCAPWAASGADAASFMAGITCVDVDDVDGVGVRFGSDRACIICVTTGPAPFPSAVLRVATLAARTGPEFCSGESVRAPHWRQNLSWGSRAAEHRQHNATGAVGLGAVGDVVGAADDGGGGTNGDIVGAGVGAGGTRLATLAASPMVARSTFFIAKLVDNGCPVGGVIHDGGGARIEWGPLPTDGDDVVAGDGTLSAPIIGDVPLPTAVIAGATAGGAVKGVAGMSKAGSPTSNAAPQLTQSVVPGSL